MRFKIMLDIETSNPQVEVLKKTKNSVTMRVTDYQTVMELISRFLEKENFRVLESDIKLVKEN